MFSGMSGQTQVLIGYVYSAIRIAAFVQMKYYSDNPICISICTVNGQCSSYVLF